VAVDVRVVRSAKRRKTVQARMVDGCLEVLIPARMSEREEAHWVEQMQGRFLRQVDAERIDLDRRATALARRYELPVPSSIRWVSNQRHRWGSCSPWNGEIRISDRLAAWPVWVLDYVIVHELAHLREAGHGPRFQALVDRYPRAERARGFLIAKSGSADPDVDDVDDVDDEEPVAGVDPGDRRTERDREPVAEQIEAPPLPFG
jgi:predicted metal-dependent hydrolase